MKSKRGQISTFIIIGLIILGIFLFILAIRSDLFKTMMPSSNSVIPVQKYVEECVDRTSKYGVYRMGMQGGYLMMPNDYFRNDVFEVSYAYNDEKKFLTLDEMRQQLETFILVNLPGCLDDFRSFRNEGFNIQAGEMKVDVLFAEKNSMVTVTLPMTITRSDFSAKLEKFPMPMNIAAKEIHSGIDNFVDDLSDSYDMTYLNGLNANISVNAFGDSDLFAEQNFDSVISGEDYLFLYAVTK
jgi:hypothetical protein